MVPALPPGQDRIAGHDIRLGRGSLDVTATRTDAALTTTVQRDVAADLTVGAVLPAGSHAVSVTLNGVPTAYDVADTARGTQVLVPVPDTSTRAVLRVAYGS